MNDEEKVILEFIKHADALFDSVKTCFPCEDEERLAFTFKLSKSCFKQLKANVEAYITKTLHINGVEIGQSNPYQNLYSYLDKIRNITANGTLLPNRELVPELNALHKTVVEMLQFYGAEKVFEFGQAPINIRISEKKRIENLKEHPFGSVKPHTDVWAGEPIDHINFFLPIYCEGSSVNFEVLEAIENTEEHALRVAKSYDISRPTVVLSKPYDLKLNPGVACILDSRAVHRTLFEPLKSIRCSLDFRFRIKIPERLKSLGFLINQTLASKNVSYIPYKLWTQVGVSKSYFFKETFKEYLEKKQFPKITTQNHRYNEEFRPKFINK